MHSSPAQIKAAPVVQVHQRLVKGSQLLETQVWVINQRPLPPTVPESTRKIVVSFHPIFEFPCGQDVSSLKHSASCTKARLRAVSQSLHLHIMHPCSHASMLPCFHAAMCPCAHAPMRTSRTSHCPPEESPSTLGAQTHCP